MPRKKNTVKTSQITISTTPQIRAYLEQLAGGGLHGKTPAEAAERLIAERISEMLLNHQLSQIPPGAFSSKPGSANDDDS